MPADDELDGWDLLPDEIVRMHRRAMRRKQLLSLRATLGCLTAFMIALSGWAVVLGLLLWRA